MSVESLGKYLDVTELVMKPNMKTRSWAITNKSGNYLGRVLWWQHWRKYVFISEGQIVLDSDCGRTIFGFVDKQNQLHKEKIREERQPVEAPHE